MLATGSWKLQKPAGLEGQPAFAGLCLFGYQKHNHYWPPPGRICPKATGSHPHPVLRWHAEAQSTSRGPGIRPALIFFFLV